MLIFLRGEETSALELEDNSTVGDLIVKVNETYGACPADLILAFGGVPLSESSTTLQSLSIGNFSTIDVSGKLLGGKVHGSLARAGKVRNHTQKVEKQEKKKKRTGRAKRRMQYNRRFVNVVQTFGRRRGPNANS